MLERSCGLLLLAGVASAAPRTLVVGTGDCQSVELVTGLTDFQAALKGPLKGDLYDADVVLDIVRPRPTRSLDDVQRQVESARTLFYNGQTDRSLDLVRQALTELERAPIAGEPWAVRSQALVLQGVAALALGKKADGLESFRRVLRVEPAFKLNPDEFTPGVIQQFDALRRELTRQKKASLQVQSSPPGAQVLLEGRVMGVTPLKLELAPFAYRLLARLNDQVSYLRVVTVPREGVVQIDLGAEGALATQAPLCIAAKDKAAEVAALKLANTVTADDLLLVRFEGSKGAPGQFVASRYEIRTGSMVREGRVQAPSRGKPAYAALATFVLTGQGSSIILAPVEPMALPSTVVTNPTAPALAPSPTVASTPAAGEVSAPVQPPAQGPSPRASTARVVSFVGLGVGAAVGIAGGVVFALGGADRLLLASLRQANGKLPEPSEPGHREALNAITRVDFNQTLALSLIGVGAGAAIAGLVSVFLFPADAVALSAAPSPSGGSVTLSGRF